VIQRAPDSQETHGSTVPQPPRKPFQPTQDRRRELLNPGAYLRYPAQNTVAYDIFRITSVSQIPPIRNTQKNDLTLSLDFFGFEVPSITRTVWATNGVVELIHHVAHGVDPHLADFFEPHIEDLLVLGIIRVQRVAIDVWKKLDALRFQGSLSEAAVCDASSENQCH